MLSGCSGVSSLTALCLEITNTLKIFFLQINLYNTDVSPVLFFSHPMSFTISSEGASSVPAFFSEDDSQSNDSSDSDSSSSQSDDVDQETFLLDEPLERTTSATHANSAAQAPRSMQWAVRNTPSQRATGSAPPSSSTPASMLV